MQVSWYLWVYQEFASLPRIKKWTVFCRTIINDTSTNTESAIRMALRSTYWCWILLHDILIWHIDEHIRKFELLLANVDWLKKNTPLFHFQTNSANENFDQIFPTNLIVRHDGHINWIPPGLFHSICSIEVDLFPFDSQVSCIQVNLIIALSWAAICVCMCVCMITVVWLPASRWMFFVR